MSEMTDKLSERAMLIHLRISMWTGSKKDRKITKDTCEQYGAEDDTGSWWTYFVPKKDLAPIQTACNKIRNTWMAWTLPWMDGGVRVIPSSRYLEYSTTIREAINEYDKAVQDFLVKYPDIAADAENRLGKLLDGKRMPNVTEIQSKFGVVQDILPMPRAEDFRVGMEDADGIRTQIENSLQSMSRRAMADVWNQLMVLVAKVQATLEKPDKKFKNSLIENVKEFCQLLPKLNLTDDANLGGMGQEIASKLGGVDPQDLRENASYRQKVAGLAQEALNKIQAFVPRDGTRKIDLDIQE